MGKLPYIANKKLYSAVMGACSYVRATGYFNKAVRYYANKYDVSEEEVSRYVRIAQGNGQKKATEKTPKRKYYWFAVEYSMGNERNGCDYFNRLLAQYVVAKGMSADTVQNRLSKHDDYISEYSPCHWFGRVERFNTKEEAEQRIREWEQEV